MSLHDAAQCGFPAGLFRHQYSDPVVRGSQARVRFAALVDLSAGAAGWRKCPARREGDICYADRFTPRDEAEKAAGEDREGRTIAFLKRFLVFNLDQIDGLPERFEEVDTVPDPVMAIAEVDRLIAAMGADFRIGGDEAYYSPKHDYVQVPPQAAFHEPVNWFRTALHELGYWSGHASRLNRDHTGRFGSASYAKEELVAEMTATFTCASLGIHPTVRHSDYIGSWLEALRAMKRRSSGRRVQPARRRISSSHSGRARHDGPSLFAALAQGQGCDSPTSFAADRALHHRSGSVGGAAARTGGAAGSGHGGIACRGS